MPVNYPMQPHQLQQFKEQILNCKQKYDKLYIDLCPYCAYVYKQSLRSATFAYTYTDLHLSREKESMYNLLYFSVMYFELFEQF